MSLQPVQPLREIMDRLDPARSALPFSLCLACNAPLRVIAKAAVLERLAPSVRISHESFATRDVCHRVLWDGSHARRMREWVAAA